MSMNDMAGGTLTSSVKEHATTHFETANTMSEQVPFEQKETKTLLRKIDWALIPFFSLLYLLSFLDRANIGNARLAGLEDSLNMSGLDYNIAVVAFFPTYVLFEVPSNLILKKVRPSIWIPSIMVAWSICTTLMGITHNLAGLIAARVCLGLAEAGLFPGIAYCITMWYQRQEYGFRMALFFSAATCAGAFGGLLARGIMEMDNVGGRPGWSWIFILEGLATLLVAIVAYFIMPDYPSTAKFLTPRERNEVSRRLTEDRDCLSNEYKTKFIYQAVMDWKIWVQMFILIGILTPLYCISLFLPTIVRGLGYSNETAQLMSVPPYVVACAFCVFVGYTADKLATRGVFVIGSLVVALVGMILLLASERPGVRYAGCTLAATGIYSNVPQGIAWNSSNIGGTLKKSVGIAMQVGFGNLGGIISSFLFLPKDGPRYFPGFSVLVAMLSMSLCLSMFMTIYLRLENRRRERLFKSPSEYSMDEKELERENGDRASFFRYTV